MNLDSPITITFHDDNNDDKKSDHEEDNFNEILENIKNQFHSIDEKDVMSIYVDEEPVQNSSTPISSSSINSSPLEQSMQNSQDNIINSRGITPEFLRTQSLLQRKENMWNPILEKQIKQVAEDCEKKAKLSKYKAKKNFFIGRFMQITLILLGSISIYSTSAEIDLNIKNAVSIITGFSTTVISSVYTLFNFTKKSTIEFETSLGLYSLSMMLNSELLKPARIRKSPFELMQFAYMTRDKLIKKVGIENF